MIINNLDIFNMKNIVLFLVAAVMVFPVLEAQEVNFGAKTGVNFANITGDETDDLDGRTGFHIGLVAEIPFAEGFYFGPEVLYSTQGADASATEDIGFRSTIKLDYIQLPMMVRYYVTEGFSVEAGPNIGFLVNSEVEAEGVSVDTSEFFSEFDYGLNIGLGYKLFNGIFFQGRYNFGLANVVDDDEDTDLDVKWRNSIFQLSVGYMF